MASGGAVAAAVDEAQQRMGAARGEFTRNSLVCNACVGVSATSSAHARMAKMQIARVHGGNLAREARGRAGHTVVRTVL